MDFYKGNKNKNNVAKLLKEKVESFKENQYNIYFTDCSSKDGIASGACVLWNSDEILSQYTIKRMSSMSAELLGIELAIDSATQQNFKNVASLLALKNQDINNFIINNIISKINRSNIDKLVMHYIPGHRGIAQKELADSIAKNAHINGTEISIPWTLKDAINTIQLDWKQR